MTNIKRLSITLAKKITKIIQKSYEVIENELGPVCAVSYITLFQSSPVAKAIFSNIAYRKLSKFLSSLKITGANPLPKNEQHMTENTARTIINKPKTLNSGEIENVIVSIIAASPFSWTISLRSLVTLNNLIIFVI